jgi:predicted transcriptional regulator
MKGELVPGEDISPELKRFIHNTINSVEQLEVLLFLMSNAERDWSAAQISEKTRMAEESVASKLQELHAAQLLTLQGTSSSSAAPLYRYAPTTEALAQEVATSLDRAYKERKDTVIQLIFSKPMENIRVFADAFRIRRKS